MLQGKENLSYVNRYVRIDILLFPISKNGDWQFSNSCPSPAAIFLQR